MTPRGVLTALLLVTCLPACTGGDGESGASQRGSVALAAGPSGAPPGGESGHGGEAGRNGKDPFHGLVLRDTRGADIRLDDYAGSVRIFDVWASWCGPCRMGIPHLNAIYDRFRDRGVVVIGLSVDDSVAAVTEFTREIPIRYPNGMWNRDLARVLGQPTVIPTTFLVDRTGKVHKRFRGFVNAASLERAIREVL